MRAAHLGKVLRILLLEELKVSHALNFGRQLLREAEHRRAGRILLHDKPSSIHAHRRLLQLARWRADGRVPRWWLDNLVPLERKHLVEILIREVAIARVDDDAHRRLASESRNGRHAVRQDGAHARGSGDSSHGRLVPTRPLGSLARGCRRPAADGTDGRLVPT